MTEMQRSDGKHFMTETMRQYPTQNQRDIRDIMDIMAEIEIERCSRHIRHISFEWNIYPLSHYPQTYNTWLPTRDKGLVRHSRGRLLRLTVFARYNKSDEDWNTALSLERGFSMLSFTPAVARDYDGLCELLGIQDNREEPGTLSLRIERCRYS